MGKSLLKIIFGRLKGHKILTAFVYGRPFANIFQTFKPLFSLCSLCSSPSGWSSPKGCDNPSHPYCHTTGKPFWIWTKQFPLLKISNEKEKHQNTPSNCACDKAVTFDFLSLSQIPCWRNSLWPPLRPPASSKSCPKRRDIFPHCSSVNANTCNCEWICSNTRTVASYLTHDWLNSASVGEQATHFQQKPKGKHAPGCSSSYPLAD